MKRTILPFWFPNAGCPSRCIYCDQRLTRGQAINLPSLKDVEASILAAAEDNEGRDRPLEAAFFGGTFTALPVAMQESYLGTAAKFKRDGMLTGIRVSTHPQFVDASALARLRRFGVDSVELGIQSFVDRVLATAGREYGSREAVAACTRIMETGFNLVVQLMPFLPSATLDDDLESAARCAELGPCAVRLFPTVVLRGTALEKLWRLGDYSAAGIEESCDRVSYMLERMLERSITVMRIGLQASEVTDDAVLAGPYHPALGELCWGHLLARRIAESLTANRESIVHLDSRLASLLLGHRRYGEKLLHRLRPRTTVQVVDSTHPESEAATSKIAWRCDRFSVRVYNHDVFVLKEERS